MASVFGPFFSFAPVPLTASFSSGPGFHRIKAKCNAYFICDDSGNAFKFECQEGLMFDTTRKMCNWAQEVECGDAYAPLSK